jgi:hypothetical protein
VHTARQQSQTSPGNAQAEFAPRRWQKAKARWDQAYYCGRDDCVFIPGEAESVPSHDLARLLYVR